MKSQVITTGIFSISGLSKKLLTSKFHQILILVFPSPSIHDIKFWALFTQFGDNDVAKNIYIFQKFEKLTKELDLIF